MSHPAAPGGQPDPLIGRVLHETYVVEKLLGAGGMGAVYKARHQRLPKYFAVKVLHAQMAQNADIFRRFRAEAEITSALQHPHIVQVVDFNQIPGGAYYLVMEFLTGEDLFARLQKVRRLPLPEILRITYQVGSALQAAHDKGVVHRDLKPQNIFLVRQTELGNETDTVKVVDFGISKIRNPDVASGGPATSDGTLLGTPSYMSPEQAPGRANDVVARTVQYALAAIVYEMLSGRVAFQPEGNEGLGTVLIKVMTQPAPPLQLLCPDAPPQVVQAVNRAMSKSPHERFASVTELLRALGAMSAGGPPSQAGGRAPEGGAAPVAGPISGAGMLAQGPSSLMQGHTGIPGTGQDLFAGTRTITTAPPPATPVLPATVVNPPPSQPGPLLPTGPSDPQAALQTAYTPGGGIKPAAELGMGRMAVYALAIGGGGLLLVLLLLWKLLSH